MADDYEIKYDKFQERLNREKFLLTKMKNKICAQERARIRNDLDGKICTMIEGASNEADEKRFLISKNDGKRTHYDLRQREMDTEEKTRTEVLNELSRKLSKLNERGLQRKLLEREFWRECVRNYDDFVEHHAQYEELYVNFFTTEGSSDDESSDDQEEISSHKQKQKKTIHNVEREELARQLENKFDIDLKSLPRYGELLVNKYKEIEKGKEKRKERKSEISKDMEHNYDGLANSIIREESSMKDVSDNLDENSVSWEVQDKARRKMQEKNSDIETCSTDTFPLVRDEMKMVEELTSDRKQEEETRKVEAKDVTGELEYISHVFEHLKKVQEKARRSFPAEYEEELGLVTKPAKIVIKDVLPGEMFSCQVMVTNITSRKIKCKAHTMSVPQDIEPPLFMIEPLDYQILWPGASFVFTFLMKSSESVLEFEGNVLIYTSREDMIRELRVPVHYISARPEPDVSPTELFFQTMLGCTEGQHNVISHKTINVHNTGALTCVCRVIGRCDLDMQERKIIENETNVNEIKDEKGFKPESDISDHEDEPFIIEGKSPEISSHTFTAGETKRKYKENNIFRKETSEKDDAKETCCNILENIFYCSTQVFTIIPKFYMEVQPKSTRQVKVLFNPERHGSYSEDFTFLFEDTNGQNCGTFTVTMKAETTNIPLTLDRAVVAFGVCFTDSGVYQESYTLTNYGKISTQVSQKVPLALNDSVTLSPKETFIQPGESLKLSIQFTPSEKNKYCLDGYYDSNTNLLQFPVYVRPAASLYSNCPPLKVEVFATLTSPRDLVLTPPTIHFGTVTTAETVVSHVKLTNNSLTVQEFGFVDLPKGVTVQPGFGFGKIIPGQTLPLFITLSPGLNNFKDDSKGEKLLNFSIQCVTVASLGGKQDSEINYSGMVNKDESIKLLSTEENNRLNNMDHIAHVEEEMKLISPAESKQPGTKELENGTDKSKQTSFIMNEGKTINKNKKHIFSGKSKLPIIQNNKESVKSHTKNLGKAAKESVNVVFSTSDKTDSFPSTSRDIIESHQKFQNNNSSNTMKNIITCKAQIIYPKCCLQPTHILFPPTACGSYSVFPVCIKLNTPTEEEQCDKKAVGVNLKVSYEFKSSVKGLLILPSHGSGSLDKPIKVNVIFQPTLDLKDVESIAYQIKAEETRELKQKQENKQKSKTSTNLSKTRVDIKQSKVSSMFIEKEHDKGNMSTEKLSPEDLIKAENLLLKSYETQNINTKVACYMEVFSDNSTSKERQKMSLFLDVRCSVSRPDILLLYKSHCIEFGFVAVGTHARECIEIQSISNEPLSVRVSALNPVGTFATNMTMPTMLEPWNILKVAFCFTPKTSGVTVKEFTEISAGRTIIPIMLSGEGVMPKFEFLPDLPIYKIEARSGKKSECTIQIKNDCAAKLIFRIHRTAFLQEFAKPEEEKVKDEAKQTKKGKKLSKTSLRSTEDDLKKFEETFKPIEGDVNIFTINGSSDSLVTEIITLPFDKKLLKINFSPPQKEITQIAASSTRRNSSTSKTKEVFDGVKYGVKYLIRLGKLEVRELIVTGCKRK